MYSQIESETQFLPNSFPIYFLVLRARKRSRAACIRLSRSSGGLATSTIFSGKLVLSPSVCSSGWPEPPLLHRNINAMLTTMGIQDKEKLVRSVMFQKLHSSFRNQRHYRKHVWRNDLEISFKNNAENTRSYFRTATIFFLVQKSEERGTRLAKRFTVLILNQIKTNRSKHTLRIFSEPQFSQFQSPHSSSK